MEARDPAKADWTELHNCFGQRGAYCGEPDRFRLVAICRGIRWIVMDRLFGVRALHQTDAGARTASAGSSSTDSGFEDFRRKNRVFF